MTHIVLARMTLVVVTAMAGGATAARAQDHVRWSADPSGALARQRARGAGEQVDRSTRTLKIDPAGVFQLSNVSGDITITGADRRDIRIEITRRARDRDDAEARRQLEQVQVEVVESGGRVEVRTRHPRESRRIRVAVDFEVLVPAGVQVSARSVSGDVRAKGVRGESRFETVSGNVVVDTAARLAVAKSVSGNVEIESSGAETSLTASTVSGSLHAKAIKVRVLDAGSVSGDLLLTSVQCERAAIRSVSGNVEYSGALARGGRYEMQSHSGDVRLTIPDTVGFELEASSFSGDVRSDLPLTLRGGGGGGDAASRRLAGGRRLGRALRGTFGDGSASIEVTTFSGNVVLVKQ